MATLTMLDAVKANAADDVVGLIEEVTTSAPEFSLFPSRTIRGTSFKTRYRTALPTVDFRGANEGSTASGSTYDLRDVQTYIINSKVAADKAVADAYEDGPEQWKFEEALAVMEAAIIKFGSQVYYGNPSATDKGFPGFLYQYDSANMDVDAGGSTAATGSSVWAVRFGTQDVTGVFGNNATMGLGDWRVGETDDSSGNPFEAYINYLNSWVGVQTTSKNSLGRIRDLTADSGKGLTDDLMFSLRSKFPAGKKPDAYLMSARSIEQLRASRTATNATGAPAPIPEEFHGAPIIETDSITDTEVLDIT